MSEKTRLNYKECMEKLACLLDKTNVISRTEISKTLNLDMHLYRDYARFLSFLNYTREYTHKEYLKSIDERIPVSNIIYFREVLNRKKGNIPEFVRFYKSERIPYLYYVFQIRKYILPNELLLSPIIYRQYLIKMKGFVYKLKSGEIFGYWTSTNDLIEYLSKKIFKEEKEVSSIITSFIRKYYVYGESEDKMLNRINYAKEFKKTNEEIERNLYSIADLELWEE